MLDDVLESLQSDDYTSEGEIFRHLFNLSFGKLRDAGIDSPVEHHLIVLKHMMRFSRQENLNLLIAGAIAILHDIGPIERIRVSDVEAEGNPERKRLLEQRRVQNRKLHMRQGSALAQRQLLLLNEYLGVLVFEDEDIDTVCEIIRIHDNPSIGIPIPKNNPMAVSFREADRLWMLSDEGFAFDLHRDGRAAEVATDTLNMASNRLQHVIKRYQEERRLYSVAEGPFQDSRLFFRTKAGYELYLHYVQDRKRQYGI